MQKLKRNETIEKGIILTAILSKVDEKTASEVMNATVEAYKGRENKKLFTDEETDAIMQALQSMPGYTPGRFYHSLRTLDEKGNITEAGLSWNLFFAYTMLSITNPELFEDYEEEADNE